MAQKKHFSASGRRVYGAAVPGAVDRPMNYPHTLVVMVSDEMRDQIERERKRSGLSKAAVARAWLDAGRAAKPKL